MNVPGEAAKLAVLGTPARAIPEFNREIARMIFVQQLFYDIFCSRCRFCIDSLCTFCHRITIMLLILDAYAVICALPTACFGPIKSKCQCVSSIHAAGGKVGDVDSKTCVPRTEVMRGLPAVMAPMHECRPLSSYAQRFARRHDAAFIVEPPLPINCLTLFHPITIDGLRRLVKNLAIFQGAHQLDVLRMRPHQRAG